MGHGGKSMNQDSARALCASILLHCARQVPITCCVNLASLPHISKGLLRLQCSGEEHVGSGPLPRFNTPSLQPDAATLRAARHTSTEYHAMQARHHLSCLRVAETRDNPLKATELVSELWT